jgi:hypothetical protein
MAPGMPFFSVQVAGMVVKEGWAGTDGSIPTDGHGPALDEYAHIVGAAQVIAIQLDVDTAVQCLEEGFLGDFIDIEPRQAQVGMERRWQVGDVAQCMVVSVSPLILPYRAKHWTIKRWHQAFS